MSGILTRKGSLQLASGTSTATPTSASSLDVFLIDRILGPEGHVDAGDEASHRRLRQEIGDAEVELPDVIDLGVRTTVLGPRRQVAARDSEAQRARSQVRRPLRRGEVGQRDFP